MMLIELSYSISPAIPVYPGSPQENFKSINRMSQGDVCNTSVICHYIHSGTHVDAPFHFDNNGKTIDEIPIDDFIYNQPVLVDCRLSKSGLITKADIANSAGVSEADILLFDTGYCEKRSMEDVYCDDFPALSSDAALYIRNELLNVKAVAIDTLSIESSVAGPASDFPVHRALLDSSLSAERTILIFEDVNTAPLRGADVSRIYAFPIRLTGLDGAPVNIVAEVGV